MSLDAGAKLDALVAEKAMGWTDIDWNAGYYAVGVNPITHVRMGVVPYSIDIACAWQIVEKLLASGVAVEINGFIHQGEPDVDPWVVLLDLEVYNGPTAPLAICRAALRGKS